MRFFPLIPKGASLALILGGFAAGLLLEPAARAATDSFESLMGTAMNRMDRDMMVAPSGDPDRDFATMMIPHHQGAVEMAEIELRYGRDQVLRRLAEGIIVEQRQEIMVMHQAIAALPPVKLSANQPMPAAMAMPGMQNSSPKVP